MTNNSTQPLSQLIYIYKMIIYSFFITCALNYWMIMLLLRFNIFKSVKIFSGISARNICTLVLEFSSCSSIRKPPPNFFWITYLFLYNHSSHISQTSLPPSIKIIHPTQISHCNKKIFQLSTQLILTRLNIYFNI